MQNLKRNLARNSGGRRNKIFRLNARPSQMRKLTTAVTVLAALAAVFLVGCVDKWDSASPPNIQGASSMSGVADFIAKNGWNMCTNSDYLANWDNLTPRQITGLPWKRCKDKQFWAVTSDGILYVLSAPGWHGDYGGVAYNPKTNSFPASVEGFKPLGNHWYVWCSLEFPPPNLPKRYE